MLQTKVPVKNYYDEKIFQLEQKKLFSEHWLLVGFKQDLENNRDYITTTIAGIAVVVRNCNGKIKAFHNVCSHRFNKICLHHKGNGFLKCTYHGWAYNDDGIPKGIPGRDGFEHLNLQDLKLKEYPVACCGDFVFIRLKETGVSLRDSMAGLYDVIENMANALGEKIDTNEMDINANWKIVLENTIEAYHVKEVHAGSFNRLGVLTNDYNFFDVNSMVDMQIAIADTPLSKKAEHIFKARPFKTEGFQHYLLFPNMSVATTFGITFSIQQIFPVTERKTKFVSHVFSTKLEALNGSTNLQKVFNQQAADFNRQVFSEDAVICETVQEGMEHTDRVFGPLHKSEERIQAFHEAYLRAMQ